MSLLLGLCAAVALAVPFDASTARERSRAAAGAAESGTRIELVPVNRTDLERIEIELPDPRQTRAPRRPISDLMIELTPGRGDLRSLLASHGGSGVAAERRLFRARLLVVSSGRLHRGAPAWCGGFERDLAICAIDCEGGRFGLRRKPAATGAPGSATALHLIIGELPGGRDIGEPPGIGLNACSLEQADELRIVPGRGADTAEILLAGD